MGGAAFTEDALREIFLELDTSGDGFLSYRELFDGLSVSGVDWDESYDRRLIMDRLWKEADRDGNGRVSFPEFWQLVAAMRSPTEEELTRAYDFFRALDKSGDGVLDRLEIQEGLRNPDIDWSILGFDDNVSERHVFRMADVDGDSRPDIIVSNFPTLDPNDPTIDMTPNVVYFQDANGEYPTATKLAPSSKVRDENGNEDFSKTTKIVVADVDGDGWTDLFFFGGRNQLEGNAFSASDAAWVYNGEWTQLEWPQPGNVSSQELTLMGVSPSGCGHFHCEYTTKK